MTLDSGERFVCGERRRKCNFPVKQPRLLPPIRYRSKADFWINSCLLDKNRFVGNALGKRLRFRSLRCMSRVNTLQGEHSRRRISRYSCFAADVQGLVRQREMSVANFPVWRIPRMTPNGDARLVAARELGRPLMPRSNQECRTGSYFSYLGPVRLTETS